LDILRTTGTLQPDDEKDKSKLQASSLNKAGLLPKRMSITSGIRRPSAFNAHRQSTILSFEEKEREAQNPAPETAAEGKQEKDKEKLSKSTLKTFQVWCELLGTESPVNHKVHFEVFNQWCHSAQLLPFLLRCYRRFGIAGLAPGQHVGGHNGTDPFHPLVLPTVPDFCYGHCYPLHKVLQYFYGGTEQIVCSIDDSKTVDLKRSLLGLIPGQERLNNQCWFQVDEQPEEAIPKTGKSKLRKSLKGSVQDESGQLDSELLQQLQASLERDKLKASIASRKSSAAATIHGALANLSPQQPKGSDKKHSEAHSSKKSMAMSQEDEKKPIAPVKRRFGPALKRQTGPLGPGQITASDTFFSFCHGDFSMYTYSANQVPRQILQDPFAIRCHYSDFVSRSGTPVRKPQELCGEGDLPEITSVYAADARAAAPPSICLCQPTDLTSHTRARWNVQMEFADDDQLLLGDAGWFPGALGHRFTFEAKTNDVQRYVLLDSMPQASLVFMEHVRIAKKERKKDRLRKKGDSSSDESSGEESDEIPVAAKKWGLPYFHRRSKHRHGSANQQGGGTVDLMLPPLLATS